MEMSVREARAQFAHALAAAERGEKVTITKNGKAVAELGPPSVKPKAKWDWDECDRIQAELGIPTPVRALDDEWRREFDDPAFSRQVLGLDDGKDSER
jgi:prevent-host-death family protein